MTLQLPKTIFYTLLKFLLLFVEFGRLERGEPVCCTVTTLRGLDNFSYFFLEFLNHNFFDILRGAA